MRSRPLSVVASCLTFVCGGALTACDDPSSGKGSPAAPATASAAPASADAPSRAAEGPPAPASAAEVVRPAPDAIAAQHVLVAFKGAEGAPKGTTRSEADAQKRAEEIAAKARAGEDFSALVREHSDDPGSRERMGSLGKFTRDKMVKPFSDAAFSLAVGEVSAPVETKYGFHVIKRNQ